MARRHFSSQALVLIVISIAINMIGGQLASMVKLPIDVYKRQGKGISPTNTSGYKY